MSCLVCAQDGDVKNTNAVFTPIVCHSQKTLLCYWTNTSSGQQLLSLKTPEITRSEECFRRLAVWLVDREQLKGFVVYYLVSSSQQYLETELS